MSKQAELALSSNRDKKSFQRVQQLLKEFTSFDDSLGTVSDRYRNVAFAMPRNEQYFKYCYLRALLPSKYEDGSITLAMKDKASMIAFAESEVFCREANERLYDAFNRPSCQDWWPVLKRARRILAEVLGKFDIEALPRNCAFSSGATTEFNRSESEIQKKWVEATHVTKDALPYAVAFARWAGVKQEQRFVVVPGNVVFTVPKNYEKRRTCAKEPSWNMFLQKGLGSMIRKRLNLVGLLHSDAQVYHQRLAREASSCGHLATLDLKAASDRISNALVDLLFPDDWKEVINNFRSPVGELPDGTVISYEKTSSMGNGATFEVETCLFYVLCRAVCGKDVTVSVYGDDLIIPTEFSQQVQKLLDFCGFELNEKKSFSTGPFRESCGGHFYRGVDVKPFYIKTMPKDLHAVIQLHNDIISWLSDGPKYHRLIQIARECRKLVPRIFWGPLGTDGVLWAEWDEARPRFVGKIGRLGPTKRPVFQHWRVKTVRREVVLQRHDYYLGSFLTSLSKQIGHLRPDATAISSRRRITLREYALEARSIEQVSPADFSYATSKLRFGWTSVGVGTQWPRLPVRLA